MQNKELQAETKADSEQMSIATTSSPNAAKPNVGGSVSNISQSQIENNFDEDYECYDDDADSDDDSYEDYMENYIEETLRNCSCGAYQLGNNGQLYKVADCCC